MKAENSCQLTASNRYSGHLTTVFISGDRLAKAISKKQFIVVDETSCFIAPANNTRAAINGKSYEKWKKLTF